MNAHAHSWCIFKWQKGISYSPLEMKSAQCLESILSRIRYIYVYVEQAESQFSPRWTLWPSWVAATQVVRQCFLLAVSSTLTAARWPLHPLSIYIQHCAAPCPCDIYIASVAWAPPWNVEALHSKPLTSCLRKLGLSSSDLRCVDLGSLDKWEKFGFFLSTFCLDDRLWIAFIRFWCQ